MIGLEIADIKDFTAKLFLKETFDSFEVVEAEFLTRITVNIDGHLTEPAEGEGTYAGWSTIRPLAVQVIKGKELPHSFHITFRLSDTNMEKTLQSLGQTMETAGIGSFYLNLRYTDRKITAVTGCAYRSFTMDKSLEHEWDDIVRRFFRHHQIPATEL